ncbi:MAG TPA: hypothetical protein VFY82_14045 [Acidimicrobiales bacterium]|nr:hypothetical protein [Acidimicrobiales bacterium]
MTSIDELARRAGDELQGWNPAMVEREPSVAIARMRRRRTATRAAVGGMAAALVVGVGIWQAAAQQQGSVVTDPAGGGERHPATTIEPDASPVPSTAAPTESPATTALPVAPAPVDIADPARPTGCTGRLSDGRTYVVDVPAGWHANDAFEDVPACTHFGPVPVEFFDHDEIEGWASNSDVTIDLTPQALPEGMTWEQSLELQANDVSGPITPEYTTIAGQPAVREDRVDPQNGGLRWVRWRFLLGGDQGVAVAGEESLNGTPYETSVAALDSIVRSIRIDG